MHRLRSVFLKAVMAACLILVAVGCSKKAKQASLQARADGYFKAGDYDKAKIEYLNLLRADGQNVTALQQIGIIWFEQGAPLHAFPFLLKALDLAPGNLTIRTKLAQAFVSVGHSAEARKHVIAILEKAPSHDEAIVLLAETALTKEDTDYTDQHLRKYRDPDRAAVHLASATLDGKKGDLAAAEGEIKKALALDPKSATAHFAMANCSLAKRDPARALESLKAAANLAPARSPLRLKLAEFKVSTGAVEDARTLLKEMTQKTPDYIPAWRLLARIAFTEKKYDESLALLENVFSRDAASVEARVLQAQVWLSKGEAKKAVEGLERLRKSYPKVPMVMYQLARAYLQEKNPARAGVVLNEAVALNPDYLDAVLLLGEVNLRAGDAKAVVESMTALLKSRPATLQAQMLLADAYRLLGRFDDAASVFRDQIKAAPQNGASYFLLGIVLRQKGSLTEARAAFEKAHELTPDGLMATFHLVDMDIIARDFNAAHQRVQAEIQKKPDSAGAHFLSGKIYAAQRDWDRAEAALRKALDLDATASSAYRLLLFTYIEAGKLPEALGQIEASLARKPDDPRALLMSAMIYEKMNAFPKARDAYEKVISRTPDFAPALNNLAVLYAERMNQIDRAYELALKARSLSPDDAAIADTLGWIHYKRGDYKQAHTLIAESAGKIPDNPEIQFDLGMTHSMMGQTEAARTAFQLATKAPGDFPNREEAQRRLALLGDGSGKVSELSSEKLETMVKQQPGDLLTRMRLAEAYERQGEFPKAAATYEEALKLNPKLLPAILKLAQLNAGPLQNSARALELAKKARDIAPNDPKAAEVLGRASYQTGNFPIAYTLLQESVRQPVTDAGTLHDFAWAAYNMGRVAQGRDAMQRLLQEVPNSSHSDDAKAFLAMTALDETGKDLAAAEPEVQKILTANPAHAPALMVRAALQVQRGEVKAAENSYTKILDRLPDFAPAQKNLASLYVGTPVNRDKAYGMAVKARKTLPDDPELARTLAELSFHRKDFANAIQLFQESGRKRPLDAKALYYLGMSHVQAKDKEQALDVLQRAVAGGLPDPLAADAKRALAELEKD